MPSAFIIIEFGKVILSFMMGSGLFYVLIKGTSKQKTKLIEESLSFMVNVVIFMWLSKIVWNLSIFVTDPLAILAYPSDRKALYSGLLLAVGTVMYKEWTKKLGYHQPIYTTVIPIFIFSSFLFEFIEMIFSQSSYNMPYLILLGLTTLLFVVTNERIHALQQSVIMAVLWALGVILLKMFQPVIIAFGFSLTYPFLIVFIVSQLCYFLFILYQRKS